MSIFSIEEELKQKIFPRFDELSELRGQPNLELDQYFITKETSLKRALLFNPEDYTSKWIIFLGDMDLVSLNIGLLAKPKDLAVIDIDKRVPEMVFSMKFDHKIRSARYINHDLRIRMLAVLKNQYDYVFTESPMTLEGNEVYLSRAVQCAKKDGESKIILSTDVEKEDELHALFEQLNLEVEQHLKNFNQYDFNTVLGKKVSDLYILKVSEKSKETISNHYLGPMYFREIKEKTRPYKCKCGKVIEVGDNADFKDIEELQAKGCPVCGHKEVFVYKSTIKLE
ncbi:MAG: bis-aminopropyl spermidine synthase family protein [Candidatus Heimdallarchaeaceae archaeon]